MGDYYTKKDLDHKTIAELREFGKEHGISTAGCYSKESCIITILSKHPKKSMGLDFLDRMKASEAPTPKLEDPSSLSMHRQKQKEIEDETTKMDTAMNDFFKSIGIKTNKDKTPEHPRHVHYPRQ